MRLDIIGEKEAMTYLLNQKSFLGRSLDLKLQTYESKTLMHMKVKDECIFKNKQTILKLYFTKFLKCNFIIQANITCAIGRAHRFYGQS